MADLWKRVVQCFTPAEGDQQRPAHSGGAKSADDGPAETMLVGGAVVIGALVFVTFAFIIAEGLDWFGAFQELTLRDSFKGVFNPPYLAWLLWPFMKLPPMVGYALACLLTVVAVGLGAYVFGGRPILALLSFQLALNLWYGQVEFFVLIGLLLGWWALHRAWWELLGVALLLMLVKPQIGLLPAIGFWWWSGRARWRALIIPILVTGLTLLRWPGWPLDYLSRLPGFLGRDVVPIINASLGPWAFPLVALAVALPLENRLQRLTALLAVNGLLSPYTPMYSYLALITMPLPNWAYLFAFTPYLAGLTGNWVWESVVALPLGILIQQALEAANVLPRGFLLRRGDNTHRSALIPAQSPNTPPARPKAVAGNADRLNEA